MEMNSPMDGVRIFNSWPNGNGDNGGFGGGSWLALLFLIILFGGGNGWGNRGGMGMNMNTTAAIDEGMILQAVQGNRTAIDQLSTATNMGVDGINRGLAQLAVNLANNFGDVKSAVSAVNSAIATGNQQVISQIFNSINGLQSAMTQQNFDITNAINSCCCNIREAISGVNQNISNQTNILQNQMAQNAFAIERRFCAQDQLIREEGNATRASIDALGKQIAQYRYDDLMRENCSLKSQLAQTNASNELAGVKSDILTAIANKPATAA